MEFQKLILKIFIKSVYHNHYCRNNNEKVFNHFENIRGICTKTGLVRSLKKYYHSNAESSKFCEEGEC